MCYPLFKENGWLERCWKVNCLLWDGPTAVGYVIYQEVFVSLKLCQACGRANGSHCLWEAERWGGLFFGRGLGE